LQDWDSIWWGSRL